MTAADPHTDAVVAAVENALDRVIPHTVRAIGLFEEDVLATRDRMERAARARECPVAVYGLIDLLGQLDHIAAAGHLTPAGRETIAVHCTTTLVGAGWDVIGEPGEAFDPDRHEPVDGATNAGKGVVAVVHTPGIASLGMVTRRARVTVTPQENQS